MILLLHKAISENTAASGGPQAMERQERPLPEDTHKSQAVNCGAFCKIARGWLAYQRQFPASTDAKRERARARPFRPAVRQATVRVIRNSDTMKSDFCRLAAQVRHRA